MGFRKFFMPDGRVSVSHVAHDARLDVDAPIVVNGEQYYIRHVNEHGSITLYEKQKEEFFVPIPNKLEITLNKNGEAVSAKLNGDGFYHAAPNGSCQVDPPLIRKMFQSLASGHIDISTDYKLEWGQRVFYCEDDIVSTAVPCIFLSYKPGETAEVIFLNEVIPETIPAKWIYTQAQINEKTATF